MGLVLADQSDLSAHVSRFQIGTVSFISSMVSVTVSARLASLKECRSGQGEAASHDASDLWSRTEGRSGMEDNPVIPAVDVRSVASNESGDCHSHSRRQLHGEAGGCGHCHDLGDPGHGGLLDDLESETA
jgi:hypothetical protein